MANLVFNLNDGNEFVFELDEPVLTLGRNQQNDLVIDNTYISGFHAEFRLKSDEKYELIDRKSFNGTFINGQRIERGILSDGDHVTFGTLQGRYFQKAGIRLRSEGAPRPVLHVQSPAPGTVPVIASLKSTVPIDLKVLEEAKAPVEHPTIPSHEPANTVLTDGEGKLKDLNDRLASAAEQEDKVRASVGVLETKRQMLSAEIETLSARQKALQEQAQSLPEEIARLQGEHQSLAEKIPPLSDRHDSLEKEVALLEEKVGPLREETEQLLRQKSESQEAVNQLSTSSQKHQNLTEEILALSDRHDSLEKEAALLEEKIAPLREETEQLLRQKSESQEAVNQLSAISQKHQEGIKNQLLELEKLELRVVGMSRAEVQLRQVSEHMARLSESIQQIEDRRISLNADLQQTLARHEEQEKALEAGKLKLQAQEETILHYNELAEKIRDLEERKLLLEQALSPEQCTVFVFAYDLIKRLDLIDDLLNYYQTTEYDDKRVIKDLTALRSSLEDILNSHSIHPFRVPSGTAVNLQLRRRIKVVEIVPSLEVFPQPTVLESLRPGYACPNDQGEEVILRKLEVKISS